MIAMKRGWMLVSVLLALLAGCAECAVAQAPLAVTTVQDTVYTASGATASGTVLVSWSGFTTALGAVVPAGTTSATIGTSGLLSIALAPNAGATPIGSYYTATFHLSDGSTSREYWVIPVTVAGAPPVRLAAIQNEVLPTSVAMQTVSKAYVDTAIVTAVNAARVPVFGASGSTHATGVVPDPGATAGATRYLREDGTWDAPPGAGLGTMSTQNAGAVAITGGTIGGAAITGTGLPTGCAQLPCQQANYSVTGQTDASLDFHNLWYPSVQGHYRICVVATVQAVSSTSYTVSVGFYYNPNSAGAGALVGNPLNLTSIVGTDSTANSSPAQEGCAYVSEVAGHGIGLHIGASGTNTGGQFSVAASVEYMGP